MDTTPTDDRTFVVFLDSFSPEDLQKTTFLKDAVQSQGVMDAGVPRVTPAVLASIYTGLEPAETGLPAVQRYGEDERYRPEQHTLPEMAAMDDTYESVLNFHLPFSTIPPKTGGSDQFWTISGAMGNTQYAPADVGEVLQVAGPAGDLRQQHPDRVFDLNVDYTEATFTSARQLVEGHGFDLTFIGYRLLDSYTHWQRGMSGSDSDSLYRDDLIQVVDKQLYLLDKLGDLFIFGDHGSVPMTDVFRINRWLVQNDYLSVDINFDWIAESEELGVLEGEDHPVDEALPNQINFQHPGVRVNERESVAICGDPFWSGLTLLDGASKTSAEQLVSDLKRTGHFDDVYWKDELWSEDARHFDKCPDIIPDNKVGHYVTSNLHPWPVGAGYLRSGVHGREGAWAATVDLESDGATLSPRELHHVIRDEYLGLGDYTPLQDQLGALTDAERERVAGELRGEADD